MRYLFMCRSLTYAQRASKVLERSGITATVAKAPSGLGKSGCAYCVSVALNRGEKAADILRREGLLQGKIYEQQADNTYQEVML